jgi:hypothetical protein
MRGKVALLCCVMSGCTGVLSQDEDQAGAPGGKSGSEDPLANDPAVKDDVATLEECAASDTKQVGRTQLRRMTHLQLNNTLFELLGVTGDPAQGIAPDEMVGPFVSNSRTPITDLLVEQHQELAVAVTAEVMSRRNEIAGCSLDTEESCPASFVDNWGARAYRRPLEEVERQSYLALWSLGAEQSRDAAFRLVVETVLQSPFFLYHVDVGITGVVGSTPTPLTGYELASRLSYFLWNTMPDQELFDRAADGTLDDDAVLEAQVERMLSHERAAATIAGFHTQWLKVGDLGTSEKDATLFPTYTPEVRAAMVEEIGGFADHIVRDGDGLMSSLFLSPLSPLPAELYGVYGVTPSGQPSGTLVELNASERAGLLTRAAFLTAHSHRDQTSPVHRGLVVRENLLCQLLEAPPATVNNVPPSPTPATTTRERFARHNEDVSCAGCHRLMDPIGLGFESYDPIGAFRTMDGGSPVDATGELIEVDETVAGLFDGPIELSQKLANSDDVADCMASQWFRYALGRVESTADACTMAAIRKGFYVSGHNIRELLTEIVKSDAFRTVALEAGAGGTP